MRTVISSWTRADILPVSLPSIPGAYATEEIEVVKRGLADLVQRLPMDGPIDIEEYIDIDRNEEIYTVKSALTKSSVPPKKRTLR